MGIDWIGMLKNEFYGWLWLAFGCVMFFIIMMIGEIGKIGDWLFKKKD